MWDNDVPSDAPLTRAAPATANQTETCATCERPAPLPARCVIRPIRRRITHLARLRLRPTRYMRRKNLTQSQQVRVFKTSRSCHQHSQYPTRGRPVLAKITGPPAARRRARHVRRGLSSSGHDVGVSRRTVPRPASRCRRTMKRRTRCSWPSRTAPRRISLKASRWTTGATRCAGWRARGCACRMAQGVWGGWPTYCKASRSLRRTSRSLRHPPPAPVCTSVRLHLTLKITPVRPHSVPDLRPPSARIGAPNVTFLQDWRSERDVFRAPIVTFFVSSRSRTAQ